MPDEELAQQLAIEVKALSAQVAELRQRVAQLEGSSPLTQTPVARAEPVPVRAASVAGNAGLKLLNRAGAVTLFLGIIFFFKYAVDNQWIGATGRVLLGVLTGFLLLGAGEWLRKRGQGVFAQGVGACGVATLYISAYAACDYYKLISPVTAFLALVIVAVGALLLSRRHSDALLAAVGYLFTVAAPGLLKQMDEKMWSPNIWSWFGFIYLLSAQASVVRHAAPEWKRFLVPLIAAAVALQAFWLVNPEHPLVCVLFFLALAALHFRSRIKGGYVIGHLFVLLAGLRFLFFLFDRTGSTEKSSLLSETESVFLAVYGVALLIAAVARKSATDRVLGLALLGVVIAKLYVIDVWFLTRFYRISAFVALGVLLLASSFIYSRWRQRSGSL